MEDFSLITLQSLFKRQPPALAAVDIGTTTMRLVELDRDAKGGFTVQRCASEPLEMGWVVEGNIERFGEVAHALQNLIKKSGTTARHLALSVPTAGVMTRKIALPAELSDEEVQTYVEAEASQFVPFSLDDVSLDFCPMQPSAASNPAEREVLIVAARREKVQERQSLAEEAGMTLQLVDVDGFATRVALDRIVHSGGAELPVALVQISGHGASMQIIHRDEVLYDSEQGMGGHLLQFIARHYGITPEEANRRRKSNTLGDDFESAVLAPFVEGFAQDVAWAIQFFFKSTPFQSLSRIALSGSVAAMPGLAASVEQRTGITTRAINPFDGMALGAGINARLLELTAPSYMTACGLALRRFTL